MLANNILSRNFLRLLYPLDDYQVAPPGYLWILKFFSLINKSEYGLRFISLLAFGFALYFFYKILYLINLSLPAKAFLISLLGFNYHTLYYASELKPYMIDLFVIICFIYYAILFNKKNVIGVDVLIFSIVMTYVSFITFLGVFMLIMLFFIQQEFSLKKIYLYHKKIIFGFILYSISVFVLYIFFIHKHPHKSWMLTFWETKNVFLPSNINLVIPFFVEKINEVFFQVINHGELIGYLMFVLFVFSPFIFILRGKIILFLVFLSPILIHIILSYFKIYPIATRLILYWIPLLLIVMGISIYFIINKLNIFKNEFVKKNFTSLLIASIFINFLNRNALVYKNEEIKTCLNYLNNNKKIASLVYIYYGARPAFEFYKSNNFISTYYLWYYGNNYRNQPEKYIDEIKQFSPPYLILFSHVYGGEMQQIIEYLSQKFEVKLLAEDNNAYLYQVVNLSKN